MFFLPFLLIQVHGYTATQAGAAFLPFTIVLALLSRWGGRLVDRYGARLPHIVGPTIVAAGFFLLSMPGTEGTYWTTFFPPMVVLGFGMSITVAPLTTTVLNSVAQHQTGVASGINNAVAQVASLLMIAILGTVGISTLNRSLDQHLASSSANAEVRRIVDNARKGFVMPGFPAGISESARQAAHAIVADAFRDTIRRVILIAASLAFASAVTAALTIRPSPASREAPSAP
jgi:MFS family permease